MKILIVGGGGREHTLAWKLANDSCQPDIFCAPGNAGTAEVAVNLDIGAEDIDGLVTWARENKPDMTVVGPEVPLCAGLADMLTAEGLRVFGPSKAAAQIEGSKVFAKDIMESAGVPAAKGKSFTDSAEALGYLRSGKFPVVIKADGLAAGKGVYICDDMSGAEIAVNDMMSSKLFGDAGGRILVEECLAGEEASILALVDGENIVMLASSQDHKRVRNNDEGPNTGGMGAYSPALVVTDDLWPVIRKEVFERTLCELKKRGIIYKGVLYAGLMITADGPKVLEFNCRFGDPETQAIIPRIAGDLVPALSACIDGTLTDELISWRDDACVCVVMASGGYPGSYKKDKIIEGLDKVKGMDDLVVFHAGTSIVDGQVVTTGGRVLGVTGLGPDIQAAVKKAYTAISDLVFDQAQYRTDIGAKARGRE